MNEAMKLYTLVGPDFQRNLPVPGVLLSETDDVVTLRLDEEGKATMRIFKAGISAMIEEPMPEVSMESIEENDDEMEEGDVEMVPANGQDIDAIIEEVSANIETAEAA